VDYGDLEDFPAKRSKRLLTSVYHHLNWMGLKKMLRACSSTSIYAS
jgi:hypothetical protein